MRGCLFYLVFFFYAVAPYTTLGGTTISKISGGSIQTVLSSSIKVNDGSTIQREWVTVHDDSLPVKLDRPIGVKTVYVSGGRYSRDGYQYNADYTITAEEDLAAVEVRFLLFDIWGNHVRNLSATEIVDIPAGVKTSFGGKWNVSSENEVSVFYASIAYIARVRTKSGKVMNGDLQAALKEARKFSDKFTADDLDSKKE
jgi:hypothetical protein